MAQANVGSVWGLQIGAFTDLAGAERALKDTAQSAGSLLEEAEQSLQKITMTDGSTIYRARFLGVDQKTARSICSHLLRGGQNCLVISGI
jgi:D-alanyl-D-alanine carboxypeptidase